MHIYLQCLVGMELLPGSSNSCAKGLHVVQSTTNCVKISKVPFLLKLTSISTKQAAFTFYFPEGLVVERW
jgi:hypothetical protein